MDEREPDHGRDLWEAIDAYAEAREARALAPSLGALPGDMDALGAAVVRAEEAIFGVSGFARPTGDGEGNADG